MFSTTFDPDNRLVASELERRWNQALQCVSEIEARIQQHLAATSEIPVPTPDHFMDLAKQLDTVWERSRYGRTFEEADCPDSH